MEVINNLKKLKDFRKGTGIISKSSFYMLTVVRRVRLSLDTGFGKTGYSTESDV